MALRAEMGGRGSREERRGAVRFPIGQEVRYRALSRRMVERGAGRTLDISSAGALFTTERALTPGERVELAVNWPAKLDNKHPLKLVTCGRVVRVADGAAAIVIDRHEFRTQGANRLGR